MRGGWGELDKGGFLQSSGSRHVYIGSHSICVIIVTNYVQERVERVSLVKVLVLHCPGNYLTMESPFLSTIHPILLPQLPAKAGSPLPIQKPTSSSTKLRINPSRPFPSPHKTQST